MAKQGINTVDSPRTAQATARSGQCRGSKRERERTRSGRERGGRSQLEQARRAARASERGREKDRASQRDDHDARRRAQAARGTGLRAEGSTGPRVTFTGRPRRSQQAMEQPKTPASRLLVTSCIENKDELEEVA